MKEISVINNILVPAGMENIAESIRDEYVAYFKRQQGFVSSTFYRALDQQDDGATKYINIVVWASYDDYQKVVNDGFSNAEGLNRDGLKVLGRGFPDPIQVSPGCYRVIGCDKN